MDSWAAYREKIKRAFQDVGTDALIRRKTPGAYDVATGKRSSSQTDSSVYVLFSEDETTQDQLAINEIAVSCSVPSMDLSKPKNLFLVHDSIEYTIKRSKPIRPGGITIMYKLVCEV